MDYTKSSLVVLSNCSKGEEIGSTAYEVACLSPSNVLIVKGEKEPKIKICSYKLIFENFVLFSVSNDRKKKLKKHIGY